ncbi:MAG TPA: L,D-transpeptidase [Candidatus Saccharimonadales bacterium]|nr:L,D-transpeptidase [Candidatus Saccharimonadales bacterium]
MSRKDVLLPIFLGLCTVVLLFVVGTYKQSNFCANSVSCVKNLNVDVENDAVGIFNGREVTPPKIDLTADAERASKVLGDQTATGEKHIYVDLATQTLYAYQGNALFMQAYVSTGKWHPTPTGDFKIWIKLRATRMTGGSGADFYDLPNVPFVMFFGNTEVPASMGFSLHGAYWHDNFGHPMSHGCVNMRQVDAEKLFYWTDEPGASGGTPVTIYGQANI